MVQYVRFATQWMQVWVFRLFTHYNLVRRLPEVVTDRRTVRQIASCFDKFWPEVLTKLKNDVDEATGQNSIPLKCRRLRNQLRYLGLWIEKYDEAPHNERLLSTDEAATWQLCQICHLSVELLGSCIVWNQFGLWRGCFSYPIDALWMLNCPDGYWELLSLIVLGSQQDWVSSVAVENRSQRPCLDLSWIRCFFWALGIATIERQTEIQSPVRICR